MLRPGRAIQDENFVSSSVEVQSLSLGIFFFVNLIHSLPSRALSFVYSLGCAERISIPLLISKTMKMTLIRWEMRSQNGKSNSLTSCSWLQGREHSRSLRTDGFSATKAYSLTLQPPIAGSRCCLYRCFADWQKEILTWTSSSHPLNPFLLAVKNRLQSY